MFSIRSLLRHAFTREPPPRDKKYDITMTPGGGTEAHVRPTPAVRVDSVYRGWITRAIVVLGAVEAEVAYDASGFGERVSINGEEVARSSGFSWNLQPITVCPRIDFVIRSASGRAWNAHVEVAVYNRFWKGIKDFRLVIAGQVVYAEADGVILTECRQARRQRDDG